MSNKKLIKYFYNNRYNVNIYRIYIFNDVIVVDLVIEKNLVE